MAQIFLNRRISLLRVAERNTPSGLEEDIQPLGDIWSSRADVSDAEKTAAGKTQGTVVSRFVVNASSRTRSLKPKDRLISSGITFAITGIKERGLALLEITAEGGLD